MSRTSSAASSHASSESKSGCKSYVSRFNHSIKSRNFNKGDFSVQLNLEKVNNPNCSESPRFNNATIRKETDRYFVNIDLAQFEPGSVRIEPNGDRIQVRASYKISLPGKKTEYGELSHSYRLPRAEIATHAASITPNGQLEIEVPYHGKAGRKNIRNNYPRVTSDGAHVSYEHRLPSKVDTSSLTISHADNKVIIRSNTPGSYCYYHSVSFPSRADLNTLTRTLHGHSLELVACYDAPAPATPTPSSASSHKSTRTGGSRTNTGGSTRTRGSSNFHPSAPVIGSVLGSATSGGRTASGRSSTTESGSSRPASSSAARTASSHQAPLERSASGLESGVTDQAEELASNNDTTLSNNTTPSNNNTTLINNGNGTTVNETIPEEQEEPLAETEEFEHPEQLDVTSTPSSNGSHNSSGSGSQVSPASIITNSAIIPTASNTTRTRSARSDNSGSGNSRSSQHSEEPTSPTHSQSASGVQSTTVDSSSN